MNTAGPSSGPAFSPYGRWATVPAQAVQEELRRAFRRWGRPDCLRVDNGCPWGATGGLPTELSLWVLGLDVAMHWNDPGCSTQNGVVERTHGVSQRWVESHTCGSVAELQGRLDANDQIQRERYPSIGGQSRLAAYPALAHSGREYSRKWEKQHWQLGLVLAYLSTCTVPRKVDRSGKVSLYNRGYMVGKRYSGQDVYVTLEEETVEWIILDKQGSEYRRQPARELTRDNILHLCVSRHGSSPPP